MKLPAIVESFGSYFVAPKASYSISRGVVYTMIVFTLYIPVLGTGYLTQAHPLVL